MDLFKKIMMIVSLVVVVFCLGVSVYFAKYTGDSTFYMMAGVFAAAGIWFGINVFNLFKSEK